MLRTLLWMCLSEVLLRKCVFSAYIAFPLFFLLFIGWRYYDGRGTIPLDSVDLVSGKREIDEEEEQYLAEQKQKGPKGRWRRVWDAV